jgi:hypothetical protein
MYGGDFARIHPEKNGEFLSLLNRNSMVGAYVFSRYNAATKKLYDLTSTSNYVTQSTLHSSTLAEDVEMPIVRDSDGWSSRATELSTKKMLYSSIYADVQQVVQVTINTAENPVFFQPWNCLVGVSTAVIGLENTLTRWPFKPKDTIYDNMSGWWIAFKYEFRFIPTSMMFQNYEGDDDNEMPADFQIHCRISDDADWESILNKTGNTVVDYDIGLDTHGVAYSQIRLTVTKLIGQYSEVLNMRRWLVRGYHTDGRLMTTSDSYAEGDKGSNAVNEITSLSGTAHNELTWSNLLPKEFTMCWATRWTHSQLLTNVEIGRVSGNPPPYAKHSRVVLHDYELNAESELVNAAGYGHHKHFSGGVKYAGAMWAEYLQEDPVELQKQWGIECFTNYEPLDRQKNSCAGFTIWWVETCQSDRQH